MYCSSVWNPWLRKDIDIIEKIQRRLTNTIHELTDLPYIQSLRKLSAFTLPNKQHSLVYKCLLGYLNCSPSDLGLPIVTLCTRGSGLCLCRQPVRNCICASLFSHRAAALWNRLPVSAVTCTSLRTFKLKFYVTYLIFSVAHLDG